MIFVNLPVADLAASRAFFTAMGYSFDENFSDDNAAALVLGDGIVAMLLRHEFYRTFIGHKQIVDAKTTSGVLVALSTDTREEVDALADAAIAAGATAGRTEDHGFMYGRSYDDLDGHTWELTWMDTAAMESMPPA